MIWVMAIGVQAMQTEYNFQPSNYEFIAVINIRTRFCFSELQFQIFKNIIPNKLVNKCTCYIMLQGYL